VEPTGIPLAAAGVVVCATLMIHNKAPVVCSLCILVYDILDSLELLAEVGRRRGVEGGDVWGKGRQYLYRDVWGGVCV
jgi:hypothetical protein